MIEHPNRQLAILLAKRAFIALNENGQVAKTEDGVCNVFLTEQEIVDLCEVVFDMGVRTGMEALREVRRRRSPKSSGLHRRVEVGAVELIRRKVR